MSGRETALARARVLRKHLLAHGVPGVSIELQEGRPTSGDPWNACRPVGVTSHHVASHPTPDNPVPGLSLVKRGRPEDNLGGPLANGAAGVDLVYRILCMGYANHPGVGGPLTLRGPLGTFTVPEDIGRPYLWGTEYEGGFTDEVWDRVYTHRRTGKKMTFREFMGRCNAGLVEGIWAINGHGKTPTAGMDLSGYHLEHKTWAPARKIDRRNYTTESGRAEVRRYAESEDDMPTPADLWNYEINPVGKDTEPVPARQMLRETHHRAGVAREGAAAARKAAIEANAAAQAALATAQRNRSAIRALGQRLDAIAPGIASDVVAALGDEIKVDVTVRVADDTPEQG